MKQFPIDIFGSRWVVKVGSYDEMPNLDRENDGDCDFSIRLIQILDIRNAPNTSYGVDKYEEMHRTLRHELTHAALMECGLLAGRKYYHENIADWVAVKHHALHAVIVEAERSFDLLMKEGVDAKA